MLSLYRAWLPPLGGPRPAPPPGAHRPVPRRAVPPPASPLSSASSELDVVNDGPESRTRSPPRAPAAASAATAAAVLDVACCDGPVRFSRVLNEAWRAPEPPACRARADLQYYPCKTCGSRFPSYYFVHKHRKACHPDEEPAASTSSAAAAVD